VSTQYRHSARSKLRGRHAFLLNVSTLALATSQLLATPAQAQVSIGNGSSTVLLQNTGPAGSTTYIVPSGTAITAAGDGIQGNGTQNWILANYGKITGTTGGIRLSSATLNGATVDNYGVIINTGTAAGGAHAGILLLNGGRVTNHQGATIQSNSDGIYSAAAGTTVVNDGTILTNVTGVYLLRGGTFTQGATGRIDNNGGTNYGVIGDGSTLNGSNAGIINSTNIGLWYRGSIGSFTNTGNISGATGVILATSGNSLTNTGTLTGTGGTAISITGNNNRLVLGTGSILNGNAVSTGTGNTLRLEGSASEDSNFTGFSTLTMAGTSWTLSGMVSTTAGTANATDVQSGTLIIAGALSNNGGGGTSIANGATLQLGDGGATGSVTGNIADNGAFIFNRSDAGLTVAGVISGVGEVRQIGAGTTTLTGANSYTGATTISAGRLALAGAGSIAQSSGVQADGIFDISAIAGGTASIRTLSGAGHVQLGGKTLNLTQASSIFAGSIQGTGGLQVVAGTEILTGANSYTGGTTISAGTLQLGNGGTTGSIVGDVVNDGSLVFNRSNQLVFDGAISGSGAVTQAGSGTTVLTAVHSYSGATMVNAGTLVIGDAAHPSAALAGGGPVSIAAGARLGGYGSIAGDVANFGTLAVADAVPALAGGPKGQFGIAGTLANAGFAQIGGAGIGNRLMVGGYVGQNGMVGLNTRLGGDGSPSDLLVINGGTATGTSALRIANAGGAGALTTGIGILVVDALNGATTAPGAFALGQRVVAGPYEYNLYRSSRDGSNAEAWYLRSTLDCSLSPGAPVCQPPPTPPAEPARANYRAETSLYAALPAMALGYGRALINSLHERVGEERPGVAPGGGEGARPTLGWARVIALTGNRLGSPDGIFGNGPKFGYDIFAFQTGLDLYRGERADGGRDHAGIYVAYGQTSARVTHFTGNRAGANTIDATTFGGYWTRFGASGWYLDGVAQVTWNEAKAHSVAGMGLSTSGAGLALSLEGGYPVQLGQGWLVEPQAQLIYQTVGLDAARDAAATVRFTQVDSLAGRIGLRVARSWAAAATDAKPRLITAWARANLWHEFRGNPLTQFSAEAGFLPFRAGLGGSSAEFNAGLDAQIAPNAAVVLNAGYEVGLDGRAQAYNGKLGLGVNW
jgi:outer membrane autotransporter protein